MQAAGWELQYHVSGAEQVDGNIRKLMNWPSYTTTAVRSFESKERLCAVVRP